MPVIKYRKAMHRNPKPYKPVECIIGFKGKDKFIVPHSQAKKLPMRRFKTNSVIEGLTEDEVFDIATEILMFSYESIGLETVEHS